MKANTAVILLADDDEDDLLLTADALREAKVTDDLKMVRNGCELLDYLRHRGEHMAPVESPRPNLILLDLNMPQMDGCEALRELKSDPELRSIPVVILTTSHTSEDLTRSYDLGANSFVVKPVTFDGLVRTMKVSAEYWFQTVQLPQTAKECS